MQTKRKITLNFNEMPSPPICLLLGHLPIAQVYFNAFLEVFGVFVNDFLIDAVSEYDRVMSFLEEDDIVDTFYTMAAGQNIPFDVVFAYDFADPFIDFIDPCDNCKRAIIAMVVGPTGGG